ncbi:Sugar tr and/or MFS 1 domain containing protein [Asbolus verrucosus]|uniref:Sugar tr and/or MFS 1 domain containing protein n=1 Tax=Asbolus verrucosus TaxID=1661398 RepID=A0A482W0P2_ASBVE|nr:Sugar tr and/or MFS 1 domain containing protein [Asbolus verrucosus]
MQKNSVTHMSYMFTGTLPQIVAAITGTVSAISDGMHYGWTAPIIPILQSKNSPIKISKSDENWLETTYLIGGIAGLPITIFLVDRIGRKNSTIAASCTSLLSWILIALAPNVAYLYVARFLSGLAGDVAFVATPMYIAEIADQKIRGLLASLIYLMMLAGILLIYSIAPFTPFYVPSVVGGLLLIGQLASFPFMPKSPYYLLMKKKDDAARKCLNKLRTTENNKQELEAMSRAVERQKKEKGRPRDLLIVNSNRKAIIVMTVLNGAQHFCGISVITVSWIPVTCVMIYATVFKIGLGIVPIVISAELFPNKVKAMGMTVADAMYLIFGLLSIELYKNLSDSYGYHVPFYIFAVLSFMTTVFCVLVVPETKGKTLEEIQFLLKGQSENTRNDDSII